MRRNGLWRRITSRLWAFAFGSAVQAKLRSRPGYWNRAKELRQHKTIIEDTEYKRVAIEPKIWGLLWHPSGDHCYAGAGTSKASFWKHFYKTHTNEKRSNLSFQNHVRLLKMKKGTEKNMGLEIAKVGTMLRMKNECMQGGSEKRGIKKSVILSSQNSSRIMLEQQILQP